MPVTSLPRGISANRMTIAAGTYLGRYEIRATLLNHFAAEKLNVLRPSAQNKPL